MVTVTLLPAEHCPGSVMFLFEGSEGTVLYTGDYRLSRADLDSMPGLHAGNELKEIQSIYIDTTFCVPHGLFIPSRDQSLAAVVDIAQEWLSVSPHHMVQICHKAALGYENLFKHLSLHFNMKVHVHPNKYQQYRKVGDMAEYTTPDPTMTRLHACRWTNHSSSSPLPCGYMPENCNELQLRKITVSTMCFVEKVGLDTYAHRTNEKYFRVCYSFHPSYSEVRDTILYLKPQRAFANVVPAGETMDRVQKRLDHFVELAQINVLTSSTNQYKALGKLKVRKRKQQSFKQSQQSNESDLHFGDIGESPNHAKRQKSDADLHNLKTEFPSLCGDQPSEGDIEPQDSENPLNNDDDDLETDQENDLDLRLSLLANDQDDLALFEPKHPNEFGSVLGYISEDDYESEHQLKESSDTVDNLLLNGCIDSDDSEILANSSCKKSYDMDEGEGVVLPNGRVDLSAKVKKNTNLQSVDNDFDSSTSKDSAYTKESGSSSVEVVPVASSREKISKPTDRNISAESGDVILLDDEISPRYSATLESVKMKESVAILKGISTDNSEAVEGKVMATIDLTEVDDDDDVYPSTSAQDPVFDFQAKNLFNRFSHPALRQSPLFTADDDIEYSEREVECSDDECECGGKANGGTHKYMVPKPKSLLTQNFYARTQVHDSDGSDDGEVPAHVRTRKWIESQSLYMQRRNYINSQPVATSDIIIIESDDEGDDSSSAEDNETGENLNPTSTTAENKTESASVVEQENGTSEQNQEVNSVQNREKDSLSADLSLTSCPTNLSVLAQASNPSLKNAILNGTEQAAKIVNGEPELKSHLGREDQGSLS